MKSLTFLLLPLLLCLSGCTESGPETTTETDLSSPDQPPARAQDEFLGTWAGPDFYPLIEITRAGDTYRVREVYGLDNAQGTVYPATMENEKLTAVGEEANFYKLTLPTFAPRPNGTLYYVSGASQVELEPSDQGMPAITYGPPVNND